MKKVLYLASVVIGLISGVAIASGDANFDPLILAKGFTSQNSTVTGHTGGSFPLSSIALKDSKNSPCIGYGDTKPDHILQLQSDFSQLRIAIDSGGKDSTIVVKGGGKLLCGYDQDGTKDAMVEDTNWRTGTYQVWVGSMEAGKRWSYRLYAEP